MEASSLAMTGVGSAGGFGPFMQIFSGIGQYMAASADAKNQQAVANYQASLHEQKAADERAAASRKALAQRRETERVLSRQIALAAASGGGVNTPSLLDIYADTFKEGEYQAQVETYVGEKRARDEEEQATLTRLQGKAAANRIKAGALGNVFSAFGSGLKSANAFG